MHSVRSTIIGPNVPHPPPSANPPPNHMPPTPRWLSQSQSQSPSPPPQQQQHYYDRHRKNPFPFLRSHRRTKPVIWFTAALCVIFSLLLILAGVVTLIVFLVIKPKHPTFEASGATLNGVYLDTPLFFNGDLTFLANFTNPNRKIDMMFQYVGIELYFGDRLIATQALDSFQQRRGEGRLEEVHMVSSEVYLPPVLSTELQRQMRSNRVRYNIRGNFRVKASLGIGHYSYWLYGRCLIDLAAPPSGALLGRSCATKR
ncbi:Late embryogenesis abundant (LEA) hydroxyproline-rich glycoproteinfamily [Zostera marina]|uniref:Late embryogenesis abundant (LEA) hydroxyproline-rich glycoproteinfamily n=1 Tax=Zostera marina TaxID=29655 RepID=A0A0K9P551_ZOSMR|nr:Late embryogenesis abundant (LEA) hydroxyproline-rich glycoproteinfamily [Zostera marina]